MRVLIVTGTYPTANRPSAGIFVRGQFRYLRRNAAEGDRIDLFRVQRRSRSAFIAVLKTLWAGILFIPVLTRRYDVVHVHFVGPMLYISRIYQLLHPRAKLVLTVHGSGLKFDPVEAKRVHARYADIVSDVDYVIASGAGMTQRIREQLGRDPDESLCAGVDTSLFHRLYATPRAKQYDFIYVGSFRQSKGIDVFLSALEKLRDIDISVCFVGNGPMLRTIRAASHDSDIRTYTDVKQRELCELYNSARFLVFPSRGDGFGLVVTEAMYCGTPAIVFADSGAREQVRHNFNGLVYKTNTAEKLAKALRDAAEMPNNAYLAMSDNAVKSNQDHSLTNTGQRLLAIYRDLTAS